MADLVTLEEYKLFVHRNYQTGDLKNENDIYYSNLLIPGLSHAFEKYFDNDFQSISRTETFSIERATKKLYPRYKPIASITSVTVDGTALDSDQYALLADQNAVVMQTIINLPSTRAEAYYWPVGFNHIVIVYVGGLAITRVHKYLICALMNKIDVGFQNILLVEEAVERELSLPENQLLESTFRNMNI